MPSSTSSFSREIPSAPWPRLACVAGLAVALFMGAWEMHWRRQGYVPTLDDNTDQWSRQRERLDKPDAPGMVIVGTSRALFDLKLDRLTPVTGQQPLQLAIVGSSPLPILKHIAEDTQYRGIVVCDVTPLLYFMAGGPLLQRSYDWIAYYKNWSPSQRLGQRLDLWLQQRFAFIQQEDLTLNLLLARWAPPNRPGAQVPPRMPPYMYTLEPDRQAGMTERLETDPAFQAELKSIWQGLFGFPPPDEATRVRLIEETAAAVDQIRARGGQVVFIRPPSTGWIYEQEEQKTPRKLCWDALLKRTGAPGFHFENHPELRAMNCPEWSHISRADAVRYAEILAGQIAKVVRSTPGIQR